MTGLGIIEVAIGLIFVYSLLSIIATTVNTIIAYIFKTRTRHLKRGLEGLLSDPDIRQLFMRHPLINLLKDRPAERNRWEELMRYAAQRLRLNDRTSARLTAQMVAHETATLTRIDWIAPEMFAKVITDILAEKAAFTLYSPLSEAARRVLTGAEQTRMAHFVDLLQMGAYSLEEFQREIYQLGDPAHRDELQRAFLLVEARRKALNLSPNEGSRLIPLLEGLRQVDEAAFRKALKVLIGSARTLEEAQTQLASWFDQRMDQLSEMYKRRLTMFSLGIGLALAVILNADTLQIARTLFDDPSVRAALVTAANTAVETEQLAALLPPTPTPEPTATPTPTPTPEATAEAFAGDLTDEMLIEVATPVPETNPITDSTSAIVQVAQVIDLLLQLNLPIGWEHTPLTVNCFAPGDVLEQSALMCDDSRNLWLLLPGNNPGWLGLLVRKLIGLALTGIAIAQGAPFWFDLLNRLVRGRSSSNSPQGGG